MPVVDRKTGPRRSVEQLEGATVRLAGDSGDGIQLMGSQLTNTSALAGNDVATFPDFPAEIRAPRGTRAGVSGFQIHFSSKDIHTPGDRVDGLVAMNPAALVTNIDDLKPGGVLIVDGDSFTDKDLKKANLSVNPLDDSGLDEYQLIKVPLTTLTREVVAGVETDDDRGLGNKIADRCKNFFALGLVYWLYGRSLETTLRSITAKFGRKPEIAEANRRALRAGWSYGETTEAFAASFQVDPAPLPPGRYRNIMGNQALALGLLTAAQLSGKELFYGSYPITPASAILEEISKYKPFGVKTFQAEDEIAAICSAIGAAFGGAMGVTGSSGPGIALKSEAMGLAIALELPLIVIDVQRGGPSTGLPTKTEQADLLQTMFGRNGESPLPILAARSPADCFEVALEAWRVAARYMVPVVMLSDAFIANGSEPWLIPEPDALTPIAVAHPEPSSGDAPFLPYQRNADLARPWALPGTAGLAHRIGGLEKEDVTGNVSYEPENHQRMTDVRAQKVANVAASLPEQSLTGAESGELLVLSWGGTYGACVTAVEHCRAAGLPVAHAHLRWLNPFPANLGELLGRFTKIVIPELNSGQLRMLIRNRYPVDPIGLNQVTGRPFEVSRIISAIQAQVGRDV